MQKDYSNVHNDVQDRCLRIRRFSYCSVMFHVQSQSNTVPSIHSRVLWWKIFRSLFQTSWRCYNISLLIRAVRLFDSIAFYLIYLLSTSFISATPVSSLAFSLSLFHTSLFCSNPPTTTVVFLSPFRESSHSASVRSPPNYLPLNSEQASAVQTFAKLVYLEV